MTSDSSATAQSDVDLLPCPFCGEAPESFPSGINDAGLMIQCFTPGCVNPHTSWIPPGAAVEKWNRRSPASIHAADESKVTK